MRANVTVTTVGRTRHEMPGWSTISFSMDNAKSDGERRNQIAF